MLVPGVPWPATACRRSDGVRSFSKLHPLCQDLADNIDKLLGPLDARAFPAWMWLP